MLSSPALTFVRYNRIFRSMANLTERLELRLTTELIVKLDNWRRQQDDLPSRSEAIRRLLIEALDNQPPTKS